MSGAAREDKPEQNKGRGMLTDQSSIEGGRALLNRGGCKLLLIRLDREEPKENERKEVKRGMDGLCSNLYGVIWSNVHLNKPRKSKPKLPSDLVGAVVVWPPGSISVSRFKAEQQRHGGCDDCPHKQRTVSQKTISTK